MLLGNRSLVRGHSSAEIYSYVAWNFFCRWEEWG